LFPFENGHADLHFAHADAMYDTGIPERRSLPQGRRLLTGLIYGIGNAYAVIFPLRLYLQICAQPSGLPLHFPGSGSQ
jgi:hypothetical protein